MFLHHVHETVNARVPEIIIIISFIPHFIPSLARTMSYNTMVVAYWIVVIARLDVIRFIRLLP